MTAGVARETEKRDLAFHFFRTSFLLQNVFRKFSQKIFADKALFLTGQSYGGLTFVDGRTNLVKQTLHILRKNIFFIVREYYL